MPAAGFGPESFLQSGRASFQTGSFCCAGQAKRTASPLTPALSPLRGEGVAVLAFWSSSARCRDRRNSPTGRTGTNRGGCVPRRLDVRRAPSSLNGERAGVRGENAHGCSDFEKRPANAHRRAECSGSEFFRRSARRRRSELCLVATQSALAVEDRTIHVAEMTVRLAPDEDIVRIGLR